MRVVLLQGRNGEVDLEVAVHDPAATVAQLAAALRVEGGGARPAPAAPAGPDARAALVIDGRPVAGAVALVASGLRPGSTIRVDAAPACPTQPVAEPVTELLVVGGLAAGARHPLAPGCSLLGRDPACSVVIPGRTTSGRHAALFVEAAEAVALADAGSTAGTWIDGRRASGSEPLAPDAVAAIGACLVRVEPPGWCEPVFLGRRDSDGRQPLHRPPPPPAPPPPAPVAAPSHQPPAGDGPRFGWAAALVPLVGGLVLARLVDPRLALFTLLGPAVLIGQWLEDKRRHRRRQVDAGASGQDARSTFAADVGGAAAAESRRRRALHPDPAALGMQIDQLGSALWSRRPGHPCFAEVAVGAGPALSWAPATTGAVQGQAAAVLTTSRLPPGSPATVELSPGSHVGIAGPRLASLAVARWVILQLAAHHGPADLRIAVVCARERAADWTWVCFLPHVAPVRAGGSRLLATDAGQARRLAELHAAAGDGVRLVVLVDGNGVIDGDGHGLARFGEAATTLTLGPSRRALPGRCTSVLELDGPDGWGRLTAGSEPAQSVLATGIDAVPAKRWSRRLAPLADPEETRGGVVPVGGCRLLDLLDIDEPSADHILLRWARRRGPVTPIGGTGGPDGALAVHLDLVGDGPHALVAGTTGAGKSELLRSLVAGLAASEPPDRLVMLLVDYKGGAAFAEAARLPHVVGVVTDLGPDEAARAIHSLEAELRRRERVLADLGLRDLAEHPAHGPALPPEGVEALPRLVVVVDELAALVAELPSFLDELVQLAARGRSLGLHLVLATQRPGSVVSATVRTNCAIRCCLRVPEEVDAVDVVGSPAPAHLDRRRPGRAFLRRGAGDLVELQVALAGGRPPPRRQAVSVRPATFGPDAGDPIPGANAGASGGDGGDGGGRGTSDLAALVDACRAAAARAGHAPPRPLWLPPLPVSLPASELPPPVGEAGTGGVVVGLVDDPARQRRLPLTWNPTDGPLLVLGSGPGPAGALQAVARVLAGRLDPGRLHVYGLDLGAQGLASLGELPHVVSLVRAGEHERLHRLVQRLASELAVRQEAAARGCRAGDEGSAPPLGLVLIDGAGGLRSAFDGGAGLAALDLLERVVVDGRALGLVVAVTADRLAAVPGAWTAAASLRLAFRGGDPLDLLGTGARRIDRTGWPDGRCLDLESGLVAQVATGGWPVPTPVVAGAPPPPPIGTLPRHVALGTVLAGQPSSAGPERLGLTLGTDGRDLGVAVAHVRPGQPFVVWGPAGSGRSTALACLAASAASAGCHVVEAPGGIVSGGGLPGLLASRRDRHAGQPPLVVVVDDADRVDDPDGCLAELAAGRAPGVHLIAAAPPEAVRGGFGHWSADLRRAATGLVLRPRSNLDADVLGVPLLPSWPVDLSLPGRAVLVVEGETAPVQVAVS